MGQRYETIFRTKEKEAALAEQTLRSEKQQLQIIGLLVVLALLIALFAVVLNLRKQKRVALEKKMALESEMAQEKINSLLKKAELGAVESVIAGQEKERKRIARELHDNVGVLLSTIKLNFDALEEKLKVTDTPHKGSYDNALGRLDIAVEQVRSVSRTMHSGILAQFGLEEAIMRIAVGINETGIAQAECLFSGDIASLDANVQNEIYKIVQEATGNALKHSGAKLLNIQVYRREDAVSVVVEDNGNGFDVEKVNTKNSLGLRSLTKRASDLGANLAIDSVKGAGTTISVEVPIQVAV